MSLQIFNFIYIFKFLFFNTIQAAADAQISEIIEELSISGLPHLIKKR